MVEQLVGPLLLPLDGSIPAEQPLKVAQVMAELHNNELDVLLVSKEPLAEGAVAECLGVPDYWRPQIKVLNAVGRPAEQILRVAAEVKAAIIVMLTHGRRGDLESIAGHVTLEVLQDPPCPVLVLRSALDFQSQAKRLRHLRRILVPLDGTPEATIVMREAALVAQATGARLLMLHVIDSRPDTEKAPASPDYTESQYDMEAWREEFLRSSFALMEMPPEVRAEVVLRVGEPGSQIVQFAADSDIDVIATAWSGKISPGRASVVQSLLQRSPCPLLFLLAREPPTSMILA